MSKVKSFVDEFTARVTGDSSKVQAIKTLRNADSALKVQIANMKGDVISLEDAVENANTTLQDAKYNHGKAITDRTRYVQALIVAKDTLTQAQEDLKDHNLTLTFLEETLAQINVEEASESVSK